MYCKKCGKKLPEDSAFCVYCGTKIEEDENFSKNITIKAPKGINKDIKQNEKTNFNNNSDVRKHYLTFNVLLIVGILIIIIGVNITFYINNNITKSNNTTKNSNLSEENMHSVYNENESENLENNSVIEETNETNINNMDSLNVNESNKNEWINQNFREYLNDDKWVGENLYLHNRTHYPDSQVFGFTQLSDTIGVANIIFHDEIKTRQLLILTYKNGGIEISCLDDYGENGSYDVTINHIVDKEKNIIVSYYSYRGVEEYNIFKLTDNKFIKIYNLKFNQDYYLNNSITTEEIYNSKLQEYVNEDLLNKEVEKNEIDEFYTFQIVE